MEGRSIAATFAGILVGVVVAILFGYVEESLYPIDKDSLMALEGNLEALANYIRNLPAGYHLFGVGVGVTRLLVGLFVASRIDKTNVMTLIIISAFSLLLTILDVLAFPHPIWYGFVYVPAILGAAIGFIYLKRKA